MSAVETVEQSPRPAPLRILPFRVKHDVGAIVLEYDEPVNCPDGTKMIPRWLYPGATGYVPCCKLLEMYRELERGQGELAKERDEAKEEMLVVREELKRKDTYVGELKGKIEKQKEELKSLRDKLAEYKNPRPGVSLQKDR